MVWFTRMLTEYLKAAMAKARDFTLEGHLENMKCPFLVMHGGHDVLTVSQAKKVYDYGKAKSVDVTLRLLSADETGAVDGVKGGENPPAPGSEADLAYDSVLPQDSVATLSGQDRAVARVSDQNEPRSVGAARSGV